MRLYDALRRGLITSSQYHSYLDEGFTPDSLYPVSGGGGSTPPGGDTEVISNSNVYDAIVTLSTDGKSATAINSLGVDISSGTPTSVLSYVSINLATITNGNDCTVWYKT